MLGKRQIGELEPSELVVTIIISDVASMPIQDPSHPVIISIIVIMLLLILEIFLSMGAYKNPTLRKILYGVPSVFYEKGKLNQKEMKNQRFNLNDLMATVRNTGSATLSEIEYIIMETNGNVSVIPKNEYKPLSLSDLNLNPSFPAFISYVIIDNGRLNKKNLSRLGFDENWLQKHLKAHKIKNCTDIFCMTADCDGQIVLIPKNTRKEKRK